MTKEDFDAEVYEYAKSRIGTEDSRMTDRMLAYRAGAEPREKQIAELTKQNTSLLTSVENLNKSVQELEKENTELKDELKKWKDEWQEQVQKVTDEGYARTLQTIQLSKAKDLLKRCYDKYGIYDVPLLKELEQFLNNEVVK